MLTLRHETNEKLLWLKKTTWSVVVREKNSENNEKCLNTSGDSILWQQSPVLNGLQRKIAEKPLINEKQWKILFTQKVFPFASPLSNDQHFRNVNGDEHFGTLSANYNFFLLFNTLESKNQHASQTWYNCSELNWLYLV